MKAHGTIILVSALALALMGCGKKEEGAKPKSKKGKSKSSKKAKYTEEDVANGGTITGTISYSGDAKDGPVKVTKDTEACGAAEKAPEGALIVKEGKVQHAVVALTGIKKGKKWPTSETVVDNLACMFMPRITIGKLGGQIVAKNSDAVLHNTHLYLKKGDKNMFNIALPNKGDVVKKPLRKAGLVSIKCDAHEWMQAYVWVSAHPYVATTDASGKFTIDGVPAGDYTAKIWHEKLGEKEAKVTVAAGGSATLDVTL